MKFRYHLTIGFVISFILIQFFNFSLITGLIIFLSSWLIDFDHYIWYVFEMKDKNSLHAIKWYIKSIPKWRKLSHLERNKFKRGIFIFHGVGFWLILGILSFYNKIFIWILIGILIHMIADWIDLLKKGEPLYNKILPLYVIKRNKNKKGLREL